MDDSTKTMMLTLASGIIKKGLITLGATAATHGIISANQTETFVAAGMFLVGAAWSFWNDYGKAIVLAKLEVLKAQSLAQAAKLKAAGVAPPNAAEIAVFHPTLTPADVIKQTTVVKVLIAAIALSLLALPSAGLAQGVGVPKPRTAATAQPAPVLTGNPQADLAAVGNLLKKFSVAPPPSTPQEIQDTTCDFSIFSKLTFDNAIPLLEKCAQKVDANLAAPLVTDASKALESAKAAGDGTAVACLTPALALLQAAEGTPAVKDASGVVTTPAVAPGLFLIGQKLREFVTAGGPSNCKTAVQATINGLLAAGL